MPFKKKAVVYIVTAAILALIIYFLYYYRVKVGKILSPFIIAVIVAYLLNPMVRMLEKRNISCMVSILLIYLFFSIFIVTITIFIIPEIINNTRDLMATLPEMTGRYQGMFNHLMSLIQSSKWSDDIKNTMFREIQNGTAIAQNYITEVLRKSVVMLVQTVTGLFNFVMSMIIAYYFIKDGKLFREAALSLTPRRWRNNIVKVGREINAILSNFIQGQLLTALIVGVMETAGLLIVNIKYPVVLGLVGGLANIIPYFGPFIGAIPAVAVALIESPAKALWTVVVFTVVQQIDNSFISPKIIEGKLGLHPVSTIFAVLVGGEFFGIIGMLVSVPIMAILKAIIKNVVEAIV